MVQSGITLSCELISLFTIKTWFQAGIRFRNQLLDENFHSLTFDAF